MGYTLNQSEIAKLQEETAEVAASFGPAIEGIAKWVELENGFAQVRIRVFTKEEFHEVAQKCLEKDESD